jgi:hypothetical protein
MLKAVAGLAAALVAVSAALAQAPSPQTPSRQDTPSLGTPHRRLSQADLNALTDARIGMVRSMLQLAPEQARFWPPVEEAMRNGAEARYRRAAQWRAMAERQDESERDPVAMMSRRADALSERGAHLRKLVEALQPLYQTLTAEQKDRMRLAVSHVLLREARGPMGRRMADRMEDEED